MSSPANISPVCERGHPVPVLVGERLLERHRPLLIRREPVAAKRGLGARCHVVSQCGRCGERLARRDQAVGEPHPQRLLAAHAAAGEDQVEGVAVAEQAGEADRAAVHQRNAPAAAVDAEHRVLGRHPQVTPRGELEAAGDGVALDGGDHRLGEQHARGADRAVAVGLDTARAGSAVLLHRLQVRAGAERVVRAREHGDGERLVGLELTERVRERLGGRAIDGVGDLGPVDRDDRDWPVGLVANRGHL